ncbi:MAG: uncharacterized protein QOF51_960 [Chloroflexota bacterium]|nr:uncharacterized protein [Chloroflexota bacterium]
MLSGVRIDVDQAQIAEFCRCHHIKAIWLFGSVLRDYFRPDSDVDVLVDFDVEVRLSLWDIVEIRDELAELFSRPVDLVELEAVRNPFLRHEILGTRYLVYAA